MPPSHPALDEEPVPSAARCPYCGGRPEYDPAHTLSAMGYTHDDQRLTCDDCGREWTVGVPIGEHDGSLAEDLYCGSCGERYGLPHRIHLRGYRRCEACGGEFGDEGVDGVVCHMKCPNCYYFWTFTREPDEDGVMLYGFPQITGSVTDSDEAYGYQAADVPEYDGSGPTPTPEDGDGDADG